MAACRPDSDAPAAAAAAAEAAAAAGTSSAAPGLPAASAVDFALLLGSLKRTPRTGWVRSGIPAAEAESISDHSHRLSALVLAAAFSGVGGATGGGGAPLDVSRCVRMAVVHDVAEAIVGDITPHCGVSEEDKHAREAAAMERIAAMLSGRPAAAPASTDDAAAAAPADDAALSAAARDVRALWREYEAGVTPEARLVKDLDRLEMLVQALEYERERFGGARALQPFFDGCAGKWRTPLGEVWAAEVERRRGA